MRAEFGHFGNVFGLSLTNSRHKLGRVTFTVDPIAGGMRLQDYLSPDECRQLALALLAIAMRVEGEDC